MNPTNINVEATEVLTFPTGTSPEDMAKAIQSKMTSLSARGEVPSAPIVNPYEDRIFKESEEYQGKKRAIVLYPDELLTYVSQPAEPSDFAGTSMCFPNRDSTLSQFAADLVATATACDAAGLSAIQVGVALRMCVVRISTMAGKYVVLVNPNVHPVEGTKCEFVTEGCLSFPGVTEKVERYCHVNVEYQDLQGEHRMMTLTVDGATGPAAQAVQHEVEHLDGKLLLSHLNIVHRDRVRAHMKRVHRNLNKVFNMTGGKVSSSQALFGYVPDPVS
jgi:peptide deformylase